MATPEDGLVLDHAGEALSCGCLITTWLCWGSFELDMASCGSSTYEGASDVSLFHTCFTFPPGTCRSVVLLFVFGFCCLGVLCLLLCLFCKCWEGVLTIPRRVLDDRQCFTARSARLKKKSYPNVLMLSSMSLTSRHARIFHPFFIGPSFRLIRFFCLNLLLNSPSGYLFNGPLYIPVVSLALLTEGRTARDIPKQR